MEERSRSNLLRILDVNLNRAAEALRVVEEICRFHWEVRGLAGEAKALRHEILAAGTSAAGSRAALLEARDIDGDVGRENKSPSAPESPGDAALRNLERAREAFRVLEEVTRVLRPGEAPRIEQARYRLYSYEKAVGRLAAAGSRGELSRRLHTVRLCLLASSGLCRRPLLELVASAIEGGVDLVQLREKTLDARPLLQLARELRELTARAGVLFVVNDRPDIAALSHADGVHLGQSDLTVASARVILGKEKLVGVSTHSVEQARQAQNEGADSIGAGPMYPTATKDAGPILGPEGLRGIVAAVDLPIFAIGGVTPQRVPALREAGARRLAVSSAILGAPDARKAAQDLLEGLGAR